MAIDDAFQAGTDAVARDMIDRPQPVRPEPAKFSIWRTTTAVPRGAAAGVAESAGMTADVLGAFGQVLAATDARSGMFLGETATQRVQNAEAAAKLRASGPDFSSDAGDLFRDVSRGYRPDPLTAHAAESLVFDASRVITKAVGYSVAGGPVAGAALTGVDEGMQVADDLKAAGVDLQTRTAVGAVQGLGTAVGVVAPVAGKTVLGTAGLVLASGPGTFVAQQAATREILQRADYSRLADQYDPLDPVGLAVSTLVPAAFGAYALRGARRAGDQVPADTNAPAQPIEAPTVSSDQVDAARVALQLEDHQAGSLAEPTDIVGQSRHDDAVTMAERQLARGERVNVGEVVDNPHADAVLSEFSQRVQSGLDEAQRATAELAPAARAVDATPAEPVTVEATPTSTPADAGNAALGLPPGTLEALADTPLGQALAAPAPKPEAAPNANASRLAEIQVQHPDLTVMLDGMDAPMRLSDFLDQVQREADADLADAPLYQLAAECAIVNGT